jgi:hypothetical protein
MVIRWFFRKRSLSMGVALALCALIVAGCGKRVAQVSGTVKYQGKELPSGNVTFFDDKNQVLGSSSITDGKYKIPQVPPGPVKITVTTTPPVNQMANRAPAAPKDMPPPLASIAIPPKYGNPEQSGLTYDVKSGSQEHPIDLN